ncbi:uncharacterized protein LOC117332495 [Pecten maximus]|uniref:uncharacterized protein LOC117332495 n=1 Tax=Pecten maximus TaxID=6579 RepID=UPI001458D553|nr:uncharacterized protein LOC117332495 [Pecten maximus]
MFAICLKSDMTPIISYVMFAVTCLSTGTSGYPHRTPLSEFMFRRQIDRTECNTYRLFKRVIQRETTPQVDIFVNNLFRQSPITGDILRTEMADVCRGIATSIRTLTRNTPIVASCFNSEAVTNIISVYGGLCTRDGEVTAFFTNLTTNFESVTISSWTSPCMDNLIAIILTCPFLAVDRTTGLEEGPAIYQRQMQESIGCVITGIDDNDMSMCGDKPSLKRLFLIIELLLDLAPGVHFTMADFRL